MAEHNLTETGQLSEPTALRESRDLFEQISALNLDIHSPQLLATLLHLMPCAAAICRIDGTFEIYNRALTHILGESSQTIQFHSYYELIADEYYETLREEVELGLKNSGYWMGEAICKRHNNENFPAWLSIQKSCDQHLLFILSDRTQRFLSEKRMNYLSSHDALTGLSNRNLFYTILNHAIARSIKFNHHFALMVFDIDRFSLLNEIHGQTIGDAILKAVATRLSRLLRSDDSIARIGGDEFAMIAEMIETSADAAAIARKIVIQMRQPFHIGKDEIFLSISMGVTLYPDDSDDLTELANHAHLALKQTKISGKNDFTFYNAKLNRQAKSRQGLESSLRLALQQNQFEVYYQPKVSLQSGEIVGFEALLRWNHPEEGLILPGRFIPIAEETGLIVPIGEWVFIEAAQQASRWRQAGYSFGSIGINFSAPQFQKGQLPAELIRITQINNIDTSLIDIEITESLAMRNIDLSVKILRQLNEQGFSISIDDFGTGYSSLAYLKKFPINGIKIDRSFIVDIGNKREDSRPIIHAIVAMAHSLQLKVVAEGVETVEQVHFLRNIGVDQMQGYYYSRPVTEMDATKLLQLPPLLM